MKSFTKSREIISPTLMLAFNTYTKIETLIRGGTCGRPPVESFSTRNVSSYNVVVVGGTVRYTCYPLKFWHGDITCTDNGFNKNPPWCKGN